MSILIRGIEMPTEGEMLCINIHPDGKVCFYTDLQCQKIATAVPVPPHGRLIDADALMKLDRMVGKLMMYGGEYVYTQAEIDRAPTIIPEEEGE